MSTAIRSRAKRAVAKTTAGTGTRRPGGQVSREERLAGAREILAKTKADILADLDEVLRAVQAADASDRAAKDLYEITVKLMDNWYQSADDLHTAIGLMFMPGAFTGGLFGEFEKIRNEIGLPVSWRRFWTGDRMLIEPEGVEDGQLAVAKIDAA